ncbi:MAG: hypothetical protein GY715_20150, partial [Planctomycetes bacterium]|nr:hypothetical protein [Planctomycetota bacterium]
MFGAAVHSSTDLNGDGVNDVLIGAPGEGTGHVYLFYGPFLGTSPLTLNAVDADMVFTSPNAADYNFGYDLAPVVDLDCDGIPEIRLGAEYGPGPDGIRIYVVNSLTGDPMFTIEGAAPLDPWFALSGDVTRDGIVDQFDVDVISRNFGRTDDVTLFDGDANGDLVVDQLDMVLAMNNLGADSFVDIGTGPCSVPCPDPVPQGFHCVLDCEGNPTLLPENVWPDCPDCPGGGYWIELDGEYLPILLDQELDVFATTTPPGGQVSWMGKRSRVLTDLRQEHGRFRLSEVCIQCAGEECEDGHVLLA